MGLGTLLLERGELQAARAWFNQLLPSAARIATLCEGGLRLPEGTAARRGRRLSARPTRSRRGPHPRFFLGARSRSRSGGRGDPRLRRGRQQTELGLRRSSTGCAACVGRRSAEAIRSPARRSPPIPLRRLPRRAGRRAPEAGEPARAMALLEGARRSARPVLGRARPRSTSRASGRGRGGAARRGLERSRRAMPALRARAAPRSAAARGGPRQMRALLAQDSGPTPRRSTSSATRSPCAPRPRRAEALVRRPSTEPGQRRLPRLAGWVFRGDFARAVGAPRGACALLPAPAGGREHLADAYARCPLGEGAAALPPRARDPGEAADPKRRAALERKLREIAAQAEPGR